MRRVCARAAGPASGEGSGLAALVVIAAVVAIGGVAVGGGRRSTETCD